MNTTETILESIGKDAVMDAGETIEQAGGLAQFIVLVGDFLGKHPWLIIVAICMPLLFKLGKWVIKFFSN